MEKTEEKQKQTNSCIVCTQAKQMGIYIAEHFICQDCEGEMVATEVHDAKYPFFIRQMRKLWMKENA